MSIHHFIITRFNLGHRDWKTTQSGNPISSEEWLKHRFDLFENFCLPSVKNQSDQDFRWVVVFDISTPDNYKKKIDQIAASYKNFQALYSDGFPQLLPTLDKYIANNSKNGEFIITTRLDNDDLIHKDFVQTIKSLFQPIENLVIDLRTGYQTSIKGDFYQSRLYKEDPFNPFISVVETTSNFKTVMAVRHAQWSKAKHIIVDKTKPLWIELVHDENKSNVEKKHLRLIREVSYDEFGLTGDVLKFRRSYQLLNNFPPVRLGRLFSRMYRKHFKSLFSKTS